MDADRRKFDEWYKQQQGQKPENLEIAWQAYRAGFAVAAQEEGQEGEVKPGGTMGVPPRR